MDRSSWLESSRRRWSRRHVYLAFPGAGSHGKNGRTGTGCPVHWTERKTKSPSVCTGSCTVIGSYGIVLCSSMSYFCQADGRIFSTAGCGIISGSSILYPDCLWVDRIFVSYIDPDRTLYSTGRFQNSFSGKPGRSWHQHDPGSGTDPGTGTLSEAGGSWCSHCYCHCTGYRYEHHGSWDIHTEKRKCAERY